MNKGTVNGSTTRRVTDSSPLKTDMMYSYIIQDLTWRVLNLSKKELQ